MATLRAAVQKARSISDPMEWAESMARSIGVDPWKYGGHDPITGEHNPAPATVDTVLFGYYGAQKDAVLDSLKQAGISAGLPANFDWRPYIAAAQQTKANERLAQGLQPDFMHHSSSFGDLVHIPLKLAGAQLQNPQLSQAAQATAPGTEWYTQNEGLGNRIHSDFRKGSFQKALSVAGILAGGYLAGGMTGGAGAAGAAGAEGAATGAGTAAGTEAALGSGISAGATGASGLSTTAGGASGLSTAGAAGTSLAPGFFAGESLYPVIGGITAAETGGSAVGGSAGAGGTSTTTEAQRQTALQRIIDGKGTTQDYVALFGQVAPSLLGMYASDKQADALQGLAAQYAGYGAPYRERLGTLYEDPTAFLKSPEVQVPVQMGTDALARALSVQGNPASSGAALQQLQSYASDQLFGRLGQEKDRLAGFGGLASYNAAAPQVASGAIDANRGFYDALGYGIGQVTTPPRSLADILKAYNISQGLT